MRRGNLMAVFAGMLASVGASLHALSPVIDENPPRPHHTKYFADDPHRGNSFRFKRTRGARSASQRSRSNRRKAQR